MIQSHLHQSYPKYDIFLIDHLLIQSINKTDNLLFKILL